MSTINIKDKLVTVESLQYVHDKLMQKKTAKIQIDYLGDKTFKYKDEDLNFKQIYDYLLNSPDFVFILYGKRAHLCTYLNEDGGVKELRFASPILSDGKMKMSSIYITSIDGVEIVDVAVSNINSENSSNKVSSVSNADIGSTDKYPSVKAMVDYVGEHGSGYDDTKIKQDLADTESRLSESITEIDNSVFSISDKKTMVSNIDGIVTKQGSSGQVYAYAISLQNLSTYDSYYFVATKEMDLYVADVIPTGKYYAICVGRNYTGIEDKGTYINLLSTNTVRYRNNDGNLPTKESPIHILVGDVVSFTFLSGDMFAIADSKDQEKHPIFEPKYCGKATKTPTQLSVEMDKLKVVINKYNDSNIRAVNLWRTNDAYIRTTEGGFSKLWYNSDSDGVVKIKDEDDFIGGYHGDETQTSFKLFIDGIEYSENSTFSDLNFDEITLYCNSDVYHCNTSSVSENIAFKRCKKLIFNRDGYTVENYWIAQESISLIRAYMGMLSVEKFVDNTYTDYLLNGYSTNADYTFKDANIGTNDNKDITEVVFHTKFGDVGIGIYDVKTIDNFSYYSNVTNYNSTYDKRLKAYLAPVNSNSGKTITSGGVIKAKATIFVK